MSSESDDGSAATMIGRISRRPTKRADRGRGVPDDRRQPERQQTEREEIEAAANTARRTLGSESEAVGVFPDSRRWPRKKATNETASPTTRLTALKTAIFAIEDERPARAGGESGADRSRAVLRARQQGRRAHRSRAARIAVPRGSNASGRRSPVRRACDSPIVKLAPRSRSRRDRRRRLRSTSSVQTVERTDLSLVHSDASTPPKP